MEGRNIKIASGTLVTIKFENSEMIVDESWFVFDANSDCLFLQRLGFFGDMALKRTTNSFQVWRELQSALQGLQLMTNDYITSKAGFYVTLESFSNSCMIAKIKFPVPIHLLDHRIIPIHVRDSHWFPAHMDVKSRCMSFLDSSHAYSAADGRKCFCGNSTEWHGHSTLTPMPQLLPGSCTQRGSRRCTHD